MMKVIIGLLAILTIVSCGPDKAKDDVDGKYIRSIGRNTIQFEDGTSMTFSDDSTTKVIYLVRHAEKDTSTQNNPMLSPAGSKRAMNLKHILQGTRLDNVFSTLYNRTIFTASDITAAKGLTIQPYKPAGMAKLGREIKQGKLGNRILVVGHSNTTKSMANVLMEENYFPDGIAEDDYDNFFVVILGKENKKVYSLKYK